MIRFLAAILLLALSGPAVAQPGPGGRAPFIPPKDANFDLFRGLLHFHGVKPVTVEELRGFEAKDYRDLIVVVLGCSDKLGADGFDAHTRKAVANGGAVLIATDRRVNLTSYFPRTPNNTFIAVSGDDFSVSDPTDCYAGGNAYQLLKPQDVDEVAPLADLFNGRPRIATNVPSWLGRDGEHAYLPHAAANTPPTANNPRGHLFALGGVGGRLNPYRALVLADPDLLSNQMLYSSGIPDGTGRPTNNWGFANALVKDFLREPTDRTKCLFVENGVVRTDFDKVELKSIQQMPSIPPIPLPDPLDRRVQAKLAEVIDGGLATLEDRTVADNLLAGPPNDPSPRRYQVTMTVLAAAAGVVLVVLMARRLLAARHRKKFVPAPSDPLFLGDDTALGSFGQRRAELLRGTDFRAAASHGVRALFAAQGLPAGYGRRRLPPLQYRGRSDRERLGGDIRDLWDAAARDEAVSLSYAEWKDLEPVLAEVHAAAAADRWRFAPTSPQGSA